jgi:oligopeptide transport system substrate-binding protein
MFIYKGIFLIFCFILCGCQEFAPIPQHKVEKKLQVLQVSLGYEPQLDPRTACDSVSKNVLQMLFDGLTRMDSNGEVTLAVAEKVNIFDEGKRYIFTLKPTLWSNQDPVTAYDFEYSWKTILSKNINSSCHSPINLIKNGAAIKKGKLSLGELGVKALNEKTLEVSLERKVSGFLEILSDTIFYPIHSKTDKQEPMWAEIGGQSYVSNGPFRLSNWKHYSEIEAVKNLSYWDDTAVSLEKIKLYITENPSDLEQFANGNLDWIGFPLSHIDKDSIKQKKFQVEQAPLIYLVNFNQSLSPFKYPSIKQAFSLSVERQLLPEEKWEQVKKEEDIDVITAQALFQRSDENVKQQLKEKKLKFVFIQGKKNSDVAQRLASKWSALFSINIEVTPVSHLVFKDVIDSGEYDIVCYPSSLQGFISEEGNDDLISIYYFSHPYLKQEWVKNASINQKGNVDFKWVSIE